MERRAEAHTVRFEHWTPLRGDGRPLRIAMLAPPWIAIPAPGYGGIEAVVEQLCEQLVDAGHDVTLFAAPGTRSPATVWPVLESTHPREIGQALYEADHVAQALAAIDAGTASGTPYDVVHDHCGFTTLAMADRLQTPIVHTMHGAFTAQVSAFYRRHGHKAAALVAISHAQQRTAPSTLDVTAVVPNPVTARGWPFQAVKGRHLLWLGRMAEVKGAHRAIAAARLAGRRLVLAGPVQRGQEDYFGAEVEPHVDGRRIVYVGEIGGRRKQRALGEAAALLMPIRWEEPFGMVMVEALICGTPVIAFAEGAAPEIVVDGVNGFLVRDEEEMAAAVGELHRIDPADCRASVVERFDIAGVAAGYERVYREACGAQRAAPARVRAPRLQLPALLTASTGAPSASMVLAPRPEAG